MELQSPQINELVKAMVAAKKEFKPLLADVKGQYGEYASSDAIKEATEEALGNHGLYFKQDPSILDGHVVLHSQLSHESGQWMASYMLLTGTGNPRSVDQSYGSSITYQRRYVAYGMLGLGKGDGMDPDSIPQEPQISSAKVATQNQIYRLSHLLREKDTNNEIRDSMLKHEGVDSLEQLSFDLVSKSIDKLMKKG